MPMENRAVQFAPFAALTGYDEEIHEAARLTDPMENLSDDALATLNLHFQQLLEHAAERHCDFCGTGVQTGVSVRTGIKTKTAQWESHPLCSFAYILEYMI